MWPLLAELHLAKGIAVDADDVQNLGGAAELGVALPCQDIPAEEGVVVHFPLGIVLQVGPVGGRDDEYQGIDVHHPCLRQDLMDRLYSRDRGAAQFQPEPMAVFLRV